MSYGVFAQEYAIRGLSRKAWFSNILKFLVLQPMIGTLVMRRMKVSRTKMMKKANLMVVEMKEGAKNKPPSRHVQSCFYEKQRYRTLKRTGTTDSTHSHIPPLSYRTSLPLPVFKIIVSRYTARPFLADQAGQMASQYRSKLPLLSPAARAGWPKAQ